MLAGALAPLPEWTDEDRRLLHVLLASNMLASLGDWLNAALRQEQPTDDVVAAVLAELETCQVTTEDVVPLFTRVAVFAREGEPTSAGRYVLGLSDPDLRLAVQKGFYACVNLFMVEFLFDFAPDRLPSLLPMLLKVVGPAFDNTAASAMILRKGGKRFENEVHTFFESIQDPWQRFQLARVLFEFDATRYREEALEAARACLAGQPVNHNDGPVGEWMVEKFGKEVLADLVDYVADRPSTTCGGDRPLSPLRYASSIRKAFLSSRFLSSRMI